MKPTCNEKVVRDRSTKNRNEIAEGKASATAEHQPEITGVAVSEVLAMENDSDVHAATVGVTRTLNNVRRSGQNVSNAELQVISQRHAAERDGFRRQRTRKECLKFRYDTISHFSCDIVLIKFCF